MKKRELRRQISELTQRQANLSLSLAVEINRLCAAHGHVWRDRDAEQGMYSRECLGCRQSEAGPIWARSR